MDEFIKLLDENLEYVNHEMFDDKIYITVVSTREKVNCPYCGEPSSKVHSRYERIFQDLPMQDKKVTIILRNRKMFCDNQDCHHNTFAETFECLPFKAKRTKRLDAEIITLSINISSLTAATFLKSSVADIGKSTVCNLIKKKKSDD